MGQWQDWRCHPERSEGAIPSMAPFTPFRVTTGVLRSPLHQLQESRVLPDRIEGGIDPEPAGREIVRNPQQGLELVERLVRLADQHVDPRELLLHVWPLDAVFADRLQ